MFIHVSLDTPAVEVTHIGFDCTDMTLYFNVVMFFGDRQTLFEAATFPFYKQ